MTEVAASGLATLVAFLLATLGTYVVRHNAAAWGLVDHPTGRSSHHSPMPRGGGLGLLLGVGGGVLLLRLLGVSLGSSAVLLLIAATPVALVGFLDDLRSVSPGPRLATQIASAALFIWFNGGLDRLPLPPPVKVFLGPLAGVAAVVWIVGVTNFFNFMDGIDGLAAGQVVAACLAVVLAGWSLGASALAAILIGAAAGFLIHNWSPARIFLGDVGSETLGFLLAGLPLLAAPGDRPNAVLATAIAMALFLLDPLVTLLNRVKRGARLREAHRDHFYQRLLEPGASHARVASRLVSAALALSLLGALTYRHPQFFWPAVALAILLFGAETAIVGGGRIRRFAVISTVDAALILCSIYLAFLVRFDGRIPSDFQEKLQTSIFLLIPLRLVLNLAFGLHRWSFRMSGIHEAVRLLLAVMSGSASFVAIFYFFQRLGPPRSVIVLEFFLTAAALAAFRFTPRLAAGWYLDQRRARRQGKAATLIVGAGSAGDLLFRDLLRSDEHGYQIVGFVDDDPRKIGTYLGGKPVLGEIERMPEFVNKHGISQVLIAIPRLQAERIRTILQLCSTSKVQFKIIPVSFSYLHDRITASMLHDLSPEDLLPRDATAFDPAEVQGLVSGRRLLVTGAAGSIGGEIARQVSAFGPESLVLVDINENDLYFLYRSLSEKHPGLKVFAEVADIRDEPRLMTIGRRYRPQHIFHAAAHKHVPLMEDAPEEAVKNNIFGTRNAARMAMTCRAERFVLISTDKAVRPSSVMGVTKRVAELVVRDLAREGRTRFTAVRFGNVLGSAGSVVPLFKQQIARGGPVTVTHPDCRRYFMTVSEAAGLVILAGLGDYGELCVLDMGEPIRILDLANHMVTMAGLVPGRDVRIEITGLRRGEKLAEEILTEEEEESRAVRNKILVAKSPPPPTDLKERLAELEQYAHSADRERILSALSALVPTFRPGLEVSQRPLTVPDFLSREYFEPPATGFGRTE
jgi:FlaA1/EpsC-like NDP-sugar epimerase/UDP-N-acetylmuramyl pentapeptide phosphotransferase/UDP-N-acetylglucosamine-1-phosphate transferase